VAHDPVQPESGVDCGGGGAVPSVLAELLPPPQPANAAAEASKSQRNDAMTFFPGCGWKSSVLSDRHRNSPNPLRPSTRRNDSANQGDHGIEQTRIYSVPIFSVVDWW
jgi:hypothetical protein